MESLKNRLVDVGESVAFLMLTPVGAAVAVVATGAAVGGIHRNPESLRQEAVVAHDNGDRLRCLGSKTLEVTLVNGKHHFLPVQGCSNETINVGP